MKHPKLDEATIAELLAVADPLERATRITEYGRTLGTLPTVLFKQRSADLKALRKDHSAGQLSALLRIARPRIFKLAPKPATQEATA